jgi:hypothetical protein
MPYSNDFRLFLAYHKLDPRVLHLLITYGIEIEKILSQANTTPLENYESEGRVLQGETMLSLLRSLDLHS